MYVWYCIYEIKFLCLMYNVLFYNVNALNGIEHSLTAMGIFAHIYWNFVKSIFGPA